jgi:hypothetical protein
MQEPIVVELDSKLSESNGTITSSEGYDKQIEDRGFARWSLFPTIDIKMDNLMHFPLGYTTET